MPRNSTRFKDIDNVDKRMKHMHNKRFVDTKVLLRDFRAVYKMLKRKALNFTITALIIVIKTLLLGNRSCL